MGATEEIIKMVKEDNGMVTTATNGRIWKDPGRGGKEETENDVTEYF